MNLKLRLHNKIEIENLPALFLAEIKNRLTIQNPAWLENEKMGRWQGETPALFRFYQENPAGLEIPRGFIRQLIGMAKRCGEVYQLEDCRRILPSVDFTFCGQLRPFQEEAFSLMLARDFGTLSAPTGSGKTVMALALIAQRRQPTLIITHTKELLNQWTDRIGQFLGIPPGEVGQIGDGKKVIGSRITVALVQTLFKCTSEVTPRIGYLIIDECHRTPARTFIEAVSAFDCRYMTGLSATPWRRDGLSRLIFWHVGDVIHEIKKPGLVESGDLVPFDVVTRETNFWPEADPKNEYSEMLSELTEDGPRNSLITEDVTKEVRNGRGVCLVLSDRKAHCEEL
jgi:superfamily II DNA or RNA helicase